MSQKTKNVLRSAVFATSIATSLMLMTPKAEAKLDSNFKVFSTTVEKFNKQDIPSSAGEATAEILYLQKLERSASKFFKQAENADEVNKINDVVFDIGWRISVIDANFEEDVRPPFDPLADTEGKVMFSLFCIMSIGWAMTLFGNSDEKKAKQTVA